jgi:transposase, IS6 family
MPDSGELRRSKYLNNLIEQDHRCIKRLVKPGMGFFSCETAWRTLQGYEVMHMIRKGQMQGVNKGDSMKQVAFIKETEGERLSSPSVFVFSPLGTLWLITRVCKIG